MCQALYRALEVQKERKKENTVLTLQDITVMTEAVV